MQENQVTEADQTAQGERFFVERPKRHLPPSKEVERKRPRTIAPMVIRVAKGPIRENTQVVAQQPDYSIGEALLKKMGWQEGSGLGNASTPSAPIQVKQRTKGLGIGALGPLPK